MAGESTRSLATTGIVPTTLLSDVSVICGCGVLVELDKGLGLHATRRDHVDNVRNDVDALGNLAQLCDEDGKDRADARQDLNTVVESDDAVVTWVRLDLSLFLDVDPRCRDGATSTAKRLQKQSHKIRVRSQT